MSRRREPLDWDSFERTMLYSSNQRAYGSETLGWVFGRWDEEKEVFVASHFAPSGMFNGRTLMQSLLQESFVVVLAVTEDLASMARDLGFSFAGEAAQFFRGEIVSKTVFVNQHSCWVDAALGAY